MSAKAMPVWIAVGGLVFSVTGGFINAVGFLGVHHHGLSHLTGQVTMVSIQLADKSPELAIKAISIGLWFFAGTILSGIIVQRPEVSRRGRRYGLAMALEGVVLSVATWLLVRGSDRGEYLAALAVGLQNAMATSYSGAVLRTTHMTGVVTDLGIMLGHLLRGQPVDLRRFRLLVELLGGFVLGGLLGAMCFHHMGALSLAAPAATMLTGGVVFFATRRRMLVWPGQAVEANAVSTRASVSA